MPYIFHARLGGALCDKLSKLPAAEKYVGCRCRFFSCGNVGAFCNGSKLQHIAEHGNFFCTLRNLA